MSTAEDKVGELMDQVSGLMDLVEEIGDTLGNAIMEIYRAADMEKLRGRPVAESVQEAIAAAVKARHSIGEDKS